MTLSLVPKELSADHSSQRCCCRRRGPRLAPAFPQQALRELFAGTPLLWSLSACSNKAAQGTRVDRGPPGDARKGGPGEASCGQGRLHSRDTADPGIREGAEPLSASSWPVMRSIGLHTPKPTLNVSLPNWASDGRNPTVTQNPSYQGA